MKASISKAMKRTQWLFGLLFIFTILAGATGCGDEEHVNIFHATFTANDEPKDYTTTTGFTHILTSSYDISYDKDHNHPNNGRDYLQINLPLDAATGHEYNHLSPHTLLLYQDAEGHWYRSDNSDPDTEMDITVTSWAGTGGYGHGTFSAILKDEATNSQTVTITNGVFEGFIHN